MRKLIVLLFLLYLIFEAPIVLKAEERIQAGFPTQSLWLSKTSVTEGDALEIYAAVYNAGSAQLRGTVAFQVDGKTIGTKKFDIAAGKADLVSVSWKAAAGLHNFSAAIQDASGTKSGEAVSLSSATAGTVTAVVAAAPPPSIVEQGIKTVSETIANASSAATPVIASAASGIFAKTEEFRKGVLDNAQESSMEKTPATTSSTAREGQVAGASVAPQQTSGQSSLFNNISQFAAPAILLTFGSPAIFYPLLCLILLAAIYALGKFVRRPKY